MIATWVRAADVTATNQKPQMGLLASEFSRRAASAPDRLASTA
jgi:hypothetical protein